MLSSTPIEEGAFIPRWQNRDAAFLEDLPDTLPPLFGYVRTSGKPTATLHLSGPEDDPILASWRYGLGRVVAFASQGAGAWTQAWLEDPMYPFLWSQAVRWALPPVAAPGLHLELTRYGNEVEVQVNAVGEEGEPTEGLRLTATFSTPVEDSGSAEEPARSLTLAEVAPGLYRGTFPAEEPGRYRVRVAAGDNALAKTVDDDAPFEAVEREVYLGYPARYAFGTQDTESIERLQALAAATGGRVLLGDEPLFVSTAPRYWHWQPAWPFWTLLALALLVTELVLRYAPRLLSRLVFSTRGA